MTLNVSESLTVYKNKNRVSYYIVYFYKGMEYGRHRISGKNFDKLLIGYLAYPEDYTCLRDLEFFKKTKPYYCMKTGKLAQSWIFDYKIDPNYFPKSIFDNLHKGAQQRVIEEFGEDLIEKADGSHMKAGVWR